MRAPHTTKAGKAKCLAYREGRRCGRVATRLVSGDVHSLGQANESTRLALCQGCAEEAEGRGCQVVSQSPQGYWVATHSMGGWHSREYQAIGTGVHSGEEDTMSESEGRQDEGFCGPPNELEDEDEYIRAQGARAAEAGTIEWMHPTHGVVSSQIVRWFGLGKGSGRAMVVHNGQIWEVPWYEVIDPKVVGQVWDGETHAYWPIKQIGGRLFGFPDSSKNGSPVGSVAIGVLSGARLAYSHLPIKVELPEGWTPLDPCPRCGEGEMRVGRLGLQTVATCQACGWSIVVAEDEPPEVPPGCCPGCGEVLPRCYCQANAEYIAAMGPEDRPFEDAMILPGGQPYAEVETDILYGVDEPEGVCLGCGAGVVHDECSCPDYDTRHREGREPEGSSGQCSVCGGGLDGQGACKAHRAFVDGWQGERQGPELRWLEVPWATGGRVLIQWEGPGWYIWGELGLSVGYIQGIYAWYLAPDGESLAEAQAYHKAARWDATHLGAKVSDPGILDAWRLARARAEGGPRDLVDVHPEVMALLWQYAKDGGLGSPGEACDTIVAEWMRAEATGQAIRLDAKGLKGLAIVVAHLEARGLEWATDTPKVLSCALATYEAILVDDGIMRGIDGPGVWAKGPTEVGDLLAARRAMARVRAYLAHHGLEADSDCAIVARALGAYEVVLARDLAGEGGDSGHK